MPGARRGAGARLLSWALPPRRTGVPYLDALACLLAQLNTWLPSAHTIPHTIPLLRRSAHTIPHTKCDGSRTSRAISDPLCLGPNV